MQDFQTQSKAEITKRKEEIIEHLKSATQRPIKAQESTVKISYLVDYGEKNEIAHYAKLHEANLIVMGTHGGNATNKILGSNTNKVIENAPCPVLAIPQGAKFKKSMNIAYATDLTSEDLETVKEIANIAKRTESNLFCVHINEFSGPAQSEDEAAFDKKIQTEITDQPISFSTWSAIKIEDGLDVFCRVNDIDILAVVKHNRSTWEKVFGEKSITKAMALRNSLPLLAFHD